MNDELYKGYKEVLNGTKTLEEIMGSRTAPYIAIEVDVKIDIEKENDKEYVFNKIKKYLDFGVSKVIWIFINKQHIIIATPNSDWLISSFDKEIEITQDYQFNVATILKTRGLL